MAVDWKVARSVAAGVIIAGLLFGLASMLVGRGR